MDRKQNRKRQLAKELFKYGLAGIFNTALGFCILYTQIELLFINKYLANIINYSIGFFTNFYINRKFTFKSKGSALKEMRSSVLVYIFSFSIQFVFVYFVGHYQTYLLEAFSRLIYDMTPQFAIDILTKPRFLRLIDPDMILMCLGIVVFAGFNFTLNKVFTFKHKSPEAHILERAEERFDNTH